MINLHALRQVPLFADLQNEQLAFAEYGVERWLRPDQLLAAEGDPAGYFWVLLEGNILCTKRVGDRQIPWITYLPRSYFGHELILLDHPILATTRAINCCYLLEFDTTAFWKMLELCPTVTRELMVVTIQRAQNLDALSLRTQKLMSLGTLTSGLIQELHPPAQASRQAVQTLQKTFEFLQELALRVTQTMTPEQQAYLVDIQQDVLDQSAIALAQTEYHPQPEQEAQVKAWLDAHGLGDRPYGQMLTAALVRVGLGPAWLDKVLSVPACSTDDVLLWIKTTLIGMIQVDDIERNTLHISQLVQAAKDYTYLDQAPLQEMDIHDGLDNTLHMLNHRLKASVSVIRDYDRSLPPICVYGSELNQVWTHLIENAMDAMDTMPNHGQLHVRTYQVGQTLVVEIVDNGVGISPEAKPHIFKQFFTTKRNTHSTGLGLPIAQHIVVEQHRGQIQIESRPGHTSVQVQLPMNLTAVLSLDSRLAATSSVTHVKL
jgi:signal transduction histidine kinase